MNRPPRYFTAVWVVLLIAISFPAGAQKQREASADDYKVYEAVFGLMDQIPKKDPLFIYGLTLNSKCGKGADLPLLNGCSFLWVKPDNAKSVRELLQENWPKMDNQTWQDFVVRNAESIELKDSITTPWRHRLDSLGPDATKDTKTMDLELYVSSVGFNTKRTEALVYVLTFSYMQPVATAGDYFLFRMAKDGRWACEGRVTYITTDQSPEDQPSDSAPTVPET